MVPSGIWIILVTLKLISHRSSRSWNFRWYDV